jgi:hypothetical protein
MGGRIALCVLLALAACKSKSDNASKETGSNASPPPVSMPPGAGSGSGATAGSSSVQPLMPTPVVTTDSIRPADTKVGGETTAAKTDPRPTPAIPAKIAPAPEPATPTQATPGELARQGAPVPGSSEQPPQGRIVIANGDSPDSSTLTVDDVTEKIKAAYLVGLTRCYRVLLTKDPTAGGSVTLGFIVNQTGRIATIGVTGVTTELDTCMKRQVANWVFRKPTDIRSQYPAEAHFRFSLTLTPD